MPTDSALPAKTVNLLEVDLGAIKENYRRLKAIFTGEELAAVVKANGYGLGIAQIGPALAQAGARTFFVAWLDEAIALRTALKDTPARIMVLGGFLPGAEGDFAAHQIDPVINTPRELRAWLAQQRPNQAMLQIDTGMSRLGLAPGEFKAMVEEGLDGSDGNLASISHIMSHLACAEEPDHPLNREQLSEFTARTTEHVNLKRSLSNSSGLFLGSDYHFDLGRPGVALYGVNPTPGLPNPMRQAVKVKGKILQLRTIDRGRSLGYGALYRAPETRRIATLACGYADGYRRSLSCRGEALVAGVKVPVLGRVSMDLLTVDVTKVPEAMLREGDWAELLGPEHDLDALAALGSTIGYELLVGLGSRFHRSYIET